VTDYYSLHGEDFVLDQMLQGQSTGFFVEVGCIDGLRFSNTLTFEERGWRGICIEAHADYIEPLRRNRSRSIVLHCAAGEADEPSVTFYGNARGSLSSLDKGRENDFRAHGKYFQGFVEQKVQKCRLDTLFDRCGVTTIDILSLDIEGYEVQAIHGLDLERYRPRIMVIEVDSKAQEAQLDGLILPHDYYKSVHVGANVFYLADKGLDTQGVIGRACPHATSPRRRDGAATSGRHRYSRSPFRLVAPTAGESLRNVQSVQKET